MTEATNGRTTGLARLDVSSLPPGSASALPQQLLEELASLRAQLTQQQELNRTLQHRLHFREPQAAPHPQTVLGSRELVTAPAVLIAVPSPPTPPISGISPPAYIHASHSCVLTKPAVGPACTPQGDEVHGTPPARKVPLATSPPDVMALLASAPGVSSATQLHTITRASLDAGCSEHNLAVQVVVLAATFPTSHKVDGTLNSTGHMHRTAMSEAIAQRKTVWISKAFCDELELPWPAEKAMRLINNANPSAIRSSINGFLKGLINGCYTPCAFRIVMYHANGPTDLFTTRYFPCHYQDPEGVSHMAFVVQLDGSSPDFEARAQRGTMLDLLALKYMPCLVTMVNSSGRVLYQNSSSHEELGVLAEESLLAGLWSLQPQPINYLEELFLNNEETYLEMLNRTSTGGTFMGRMRLKSHVILRWMGVTGCEVWHEVQIARAKDPMTREAVYIVAQWDVTETVVAQRHVQYLQRQAQELLGEILPQQVVDVLLGTTTSVAVRTTPSGRKTAALSRAASAVACGSAVSGGPRLSLPEIHISSTSSSTSPCGSSSAVDATPVPLPGTAVRASSVLHASGVGQAGSLCRGLVLGTKTLDHTLGALADTSAASSSSPPAGERPLRGSHDGGGGVSEATKVLEAAALAAAVAASPAMARLAMEAAHPRYHRAASSSDTATVWGNDTGRPSSSPQVQLPASFQLSRTATLAGPALMSSDSTTPEGTPDGFLTPATPHSVAMRRETISELATFHSGVTVLFTDIVSFTSMSQQLHPAQVMLFLNQIFFVLDNLTEVHGVYKVETIGDCYMVCGGLFSEDEEGQQHLGGFDPNHATKVIAFAKAMIRAVSALTTPLGDPVRMRVGCHSGSCMSGVVGRKMPRFCLFGDTINTASRMESTGAVGRIHVSRSTFDLVPDEAWHPTGGVEAKGKGLLETFTLDVMT